MIGWICLFSRQSRAGPGERLSLFHKPNSPSSASDNIPVPHGKLVIDRVDRGLGSRLTFIA